MRRRRQTLQVSTFPFLAVLLCTMGSLILVLLIIDRRGRDAALQRAQQEAAHKAEQAAQEADARREEKRRLLHAAWEEKRRSLHQRLLSEQDELHAQMNALRRQMAEVAARLRYEQASDEELRQKTKARRGEVDQAERVLTSSRANADQAAGKVASSNRELARMTADLLRLQQVLTDLEAARRKAKQTFSVVPYRGRRGENRRPIYIECTAQGVTFHPDRVTVPVSLHSYLVGADRPAGTPLDVHDEVVRRIGKQRAMMARSGLVMQNRPYLLLLVRPDGIESYYRLQGALKDLNVKYGYELIDADWVLDFPAEDAAPTDQAWMHAAHTPVAPPLPQKVSPARAKPRPHSAMLTPNGDDPGSLGVLGAGQTRAGSGIVGGTAGGNAASGPGTGSGPDGGTGWGMGGAARATGPGSSGLPGWGSPGGTGPSGSGGPAGLPGARGGSGPGTGGAGGRRIVGLAPVWEGASGRTTGNGTSSPGLGLGLGEGGGETGAGRSGSGGVSSGQAGPSPGSGLATLYPGAGSGPAGAGMGSGQPGGAPGSGGPATGGQATIRGPGVPGVAGPPGVGSLGAPIATSNGATPTDGSPGMGGSGTGGAAGGGPGQGAGTSIAWSGQSGGNAGSPPSGGAGSAGSVGMAGGQGAGPGILGAATGGAGVGMARSGGPGGAMGGSAGTAGQPGGVPGQPGLAGGGSGPGGDMPLSAEGRQGAAGGAALAWNGQPRGRSGPGGPPRQAGEGPAQPAGDGQEDAQPDEGGEPDGGPREGARKPQQRSRGARRRRPRPHGINWSNNGAAGGDDDDDDDDEEQPLDVLPGGPPQAKPKSRPRSLRPASIHGSRDWVIFIECQYDGLTLYPSRQHFTQAQLDQPPASNPLLQTLAKMIQRRQALLRPGEPPYRPQVRFLVRQDGMRCFHAANPLVEALGVPRTQQPLGWTDDVMAIISESH